MANRYVVIAFIGLFIFSFNTSAGYYKCVIEGKIVYSDTPCGANQKKIIMPTDTQQENQKISESVDDYYSVENQLKRLEQNKEEQLKMRQEMQAKDLERQQQEKILKEQNNPKLDNAKCEYYRALVKEEEHHLRQGYQSQRQRLNDESYLKMLRVDEANHCR